MQTNLFEFLSPRYVIKNKIRLIELFGGIGAQAKALENIGADFEHWFMCEIDAHAVDSYNAIHQTDFKPLDICKVHASDLKIEDTESFTYLLTHSLVHLYPSVERCKEWKKVVERLRVCYSK